MKTSNDANTKLEASAPSPLQLRLLAARLWVFLKELIVWVFDLLSWMWLLRIPLLGICILQLLACMNKVNLIRGAFDATEWVTFFWTSFIVYVFVWGMRMICCLTVHYGPRRFGVQHLWAPPSVLALTVNGPGVLLWSLVGFYPLYICWQVGIVDVPAPAPTRWAMFSPWLAMLAGWLLAYALFAAVVLLQRLGQKNTPGLPAGERMSVKVFDLWLPGRWLKGLYQRAEDYTQDDPPRWAVSLKTVCLWLLNLFPEQFGRGFLHCDENGRAVEAMPGIIASMVAGLVGTLIYYFFHNLVAHLQHPPPAIFYVIWLLAVLCWHVGFVAFFLDRWRLPSVMIFIGMFCWLGHARTTDYTFKVWRTEQEPPSAWQILKRKLEEKPETRRIILVAAEGGGIHSGTWVTHVLGKLAQMFPDKPGTPGKNPFKDSIILTSGVSGGSYGLMYWLDSYAKDYDDAPITKDEPQPPATVASTNGAGSAPGAAAPAPAALPAGAPTTTAKETALITSATNGPAESYAKDPVPDAALAGQNAEAKAKAVEEKEARRSSALARLHNLGMDWHLLPRTHAQRDSLSAVVRGLVFRDLFMNLLPKSWLGVDRGTAIQNRWAQKLNPDESQCTPLHDAHLSTWARLAAKGQMPAALFNSTSQETGLPVVFGTTTLSEGTEEIMYEFRNRRFQNPPEPGKKRTWWLDTSIPAAVRMSSSFTWVLPMARPNGEEVQLPVNLQHLADGGYYDNFGMSSLMHWLDSALTEYEKEKAPDAKPLEILVVQIRDENISDLDPGDTNKTDHGMIYQSISPLGLLINQRSHSHSVRNFQDFNLLSGKWGKTGVAHIHTVNFDFPYDDAALSWHLTDKQIRQITDIPLQLSELPPVRKAAGAAPRAQNPDPDSDTDPKKIIRQCDCLVDALALDMDSISHEALCSVSRNEAVVLQDCREKLMKRLTSIDEAAKRVKTFIEKGTVKEDTPEPSTTPKNNGSPATPATPNPASQPLR